MKDYPEIGDIWFNRHRDTHYLLLERYDDAIWPEWQLLILENNTRDRAPLPHFRKYCKKVA